MHDPNLQFYLMCFDDLRCDKSKFGLAPHKPILLIAIIRLFQKGKLSSTQIDITPDLEHEFEQIWYELVKTPHRMNLGLPFYHLRSEKFGWALTLSPDYPIHIDDKNKMKNINNLKQAKAAAHIQSDLVALLQNTEHNRILHDFLLGRYFLSV